MNASGTLNPECPESKGCSTFLAAYDEGVSLETFTCSEQYGLNISGLIHSPIVACDRDPTRAIVVFHVDEKSSKRSFRVLHAMLDGHVHVPKRILLLLRVAVRKAGFVFDSQLRAIGFHSRYRRFRGRVADMVVRDD
jgi:hypothetical protein